MPIPQFGASCLAAGGSGAKKISEWHMFLGCRTCDKICHMTAHGLQGRREAGLGVIAAGESDISGAAGPAPKRSEGSPPRKIDNQPQITQIDTDLG